MPIAQVEYKDKDGLSYKHPERSCKKCLKYPCIEYMDRLYSDFARYGCRNWSDSDVFD